MSIDRETSGSFSSNSGDLNDFNNGSSPMPLSSSSNNQQNGTSGNVTGGAFELSRNSNSLSISSNYGGMGDEDGAPHRNNTQSQTQVVQELSTTTVKVSLVQPTTTTGAGSNGSDGEPTATGQVYAAVSGFRPPSPTNVIQLLDRTGLQPSSPNPGPREKKLGVMRASDAEMVDSIMPQMHSSLKLCKDEAGSSASSTPFIVPTLFRHFQFYTDAKGNPTPRHKPSLSHGGGTGSGSGSGLGGLSISASANNSQESSRSGTAESSPDSGPGSAFTQQRSLPLPGGAGDENGANTPSSGSPSIPSNNRTHSIPNPFRTPIPIPSSDQLDLTESEQKLLLRDLVQEYVAIAFENPTSFSPFYKKRKPQMTRAETAKMIYSHLKHETSDKHLQALFHKLKPKIVPHFEFILEEKSLKLAKILPKLISDGSRCLSTLNLMHTGKEEYVQEVNTIVEALRKKFMHLWTLINNRLPYEVFENYATILDHEMLNERILSILFEPEIVRAIKDYHAQYQNCAATFPGRILLSSLFRNRIESRSFYDEVSFNDLVMGVEESTQHLRSTIHGFMLTHPELIVELFNTTPSEVISSATPGIGETPEKIKLAKIYKVSAVDWLHSSRIYTKLFTPATFHLVKKLGITDVMVFRMISECKFQEALWRLKDSGNMDLGNRLEDWMSKYVLAAEFITNSKTLGGGFTTTKIVTLQPDDMDLPGIMSHPSMIYGVYKPKPKVSLFSLQSLKDGIVSNHKKEVAAYRIDRMLHLNHIPLTKSILVDEQEGSIQYFIADTVSARDMNELNIHRPKQSGKFDSSKGARSFLPRGIKLFDYLIDNRDRNLDNYLISSIDQRLILIDHSWTFNTPLLINELDHHDKPFLKTLIPNRAMYQQLLYLHEHPELIEKELQHLLVKADIDAFKHRIEVMIKLVTKEIKAHGEEEVFRLPNKEDRRTFGFDQNDDSNSNNSTNSNSTESSGNGSH